MPSKPGILKTSGAVSVRFGVSNEPAFHAFAASKSASVPDLYAAIIAALVQSFSAFAVSIIPARAAEIASRISAYFFVIVSHFLPLLGGLSRLSGLLPL